MFFISISIFILFNFSLEFQEIVNVPRISFSRGKVLDIRFFFKKETRLNLERVKISSTDRENRLGFPEVGAYDSRCPRNCEPVSR